jgi:hypothetical protein
MIAPTSAPATAPRRDTVRARYPSHAVSALTPMAHGSAATISARAPANDSAVISVPIHNTAAPVAGTEMLSSSRTGSVSTTAASSVAASGAVTVHTIGAIGDAAGRTHHASATPAAPPKMTNASVPATVLSGFHGSRRR